MKKDFHGTTKEDLQGAIGRLKDISGRYIPMEEFKDGKRIPYVDPEKIAINIAIAIIDKLLDGGTIKLSRSGNLEAAVDSERNFEQEAHTQDKPTRRSILAAAEKCVCGDREDDYGSPEDNFRTIAELWCVYLNRKCLPTAGEVLVEPEDVAAMMALMKIARIATGKPKADSWVDLAGYAACGGELEGVQC